MEGGKILRAALAERGIGACATKTYCHGTTGVFDTNTELSAIQGHNKPNVLVKMCIEFEEYKTKMAFGGKTIGYTLWMPGTPPGLVDTIVKRLETLGVTCDADQPAGAPVHQTPSQPSPQAAQSPYLQAVVEALQGMGVNDVSAAKMLVEFGVRSAEDISSLEEADVNELKLDFGLKPLDAKKLLRYLQQARQPPNQQEENS
eukprot:3889975-Rhodomonas_salina.1